jgi:hypothetical protein
MQWPPNVPATRPGNGGGIPGVASREWDARFLYRYRSAPAVRPQLTAPGPAHTRRRLIDRGPHWPPSTTLPPQRCAQLGHALSAAGLRWSDNGRQDDPKHLTYSVTDRHGRTWKVSPATNFQISSSSSAQIWQASCARTGDHHPGPVRPQGHRAHQGHAMSLPPFRPEDFDERCETCDAPPGQLCKPTCDTGYTPKDYRHDTEHRDRHRRTLPAAGHRSKER